MTRAGFPPPASIFSGTVVHKRLRPKRHALEYRVFWLLLDLDRLGEVAASSRLFSLRGWTPVSFREADHGDRSAGFGSSDRPGALAAHARATFAAHGLPEAGAKVYLLSYPRVLGYSFNPISVYYGYGADGRLAGAIYEVNNTFGERHSYVATIDAPAEQVRVHSHGCDKALYVSPFTDRAGRYSFRLTEPGETLTLGVLLRDRDGPLLKTHLSARQRPFDDPTLTRLLIGCPLMTMKVTAGIHWEAAKLWAKGVELTSKPAGRRYSVSSVDRDRSSPIARLPPVTGPSGTK